MEWCDRDIGVCACGQERRLYQPTTHPAPPMCQPCAQRYAVRQWMGNEVRVTDVERIERARTRRERLEAQGWCYGCGRRPPMAGKKQCKTCLDRAAKYVRDWKQRHAG